MSYNEWVKKKRELTLKQKQFCHEYLVDFNGAQAAIRAGYSKRSARSIAQENLTKPDVQDYLRGLTEQSLKRNEISIDQVIGELKAVAFSSIFDHLTFDREIKLEKLGASVKEIEMKNEKISKVKMYDKVHALNRLLDFYMLSQSSSKNVAFNINLNVIS